MGANQQLCLSYMKDVCYPCERTGHDKHVCKPMTNTTKIIEFEANTTQINYESYRNTNIKIINEPTKITFYSCHPNVTYFQVYRDTYYPVKQAVLWDKMLLFPHKLAQHSTDSFQTCLETYCERIRSHRLGCHSPDMDSLNFTLSNSIGTLCIREITVAYIYSTKITEITPNLFFRYAIHLIHLKIDLPKLRSIICNSFWYLRHLRLIDLYVGTNQTENTKCLFQYNPNLVKIEIYNKIIWNECDTYRVFNGNDHVQIKMINKTVVLAPNIIGVKRKIKYGSFFDLKMITIMLFAFMMLLLVVGVSFSMATFVTIRCLERRRRNAMSLVAIRAQTAESDRNDD